MRAKPKGTKSKLWNLVVDELRPSLDSHLAQLVNVDSLISDKPWTMAEARKFLSKREIFCFGARINERLIGYVIVHRKMLSGQVLDIAVIPEYRRSGVARALFRFLDRNFLDSQHTFLEIVVPDDNLPTQMFLKGIGIRATEVMRGESSDRYLFSANSGFSEPKETT